MSRLILTDEQKAELLDAYGITSDRRGVLRAVDGEYVPDAIAANMLAKAGRHPGSGQFTAADDPASYASAADFGLPAPVRITSPGQFRRGYITPGHQAEVAHSGDVMPVARPVVAGDFDRAGYVPGDQDVSPGNDATGTTSWRPGQPASDLVASATDAREADEAAGRQQRLNPSTAPQHGPAASRPVVRASGDPAAMRRLTGHAPGEAS